MRHYEGRAVIISHNNRDAPFKRNELWQDKTESNKWIQHYQHAGRKGYYSTIAPEQYEIFLAYQ